jgi:SAM-dependent methyltransferase
MKQKKSKSAFSEKTNEEIFKEKSRVLIDLGCGENKRPNTIGVDFRKMNGVDVIQDLSTYPWHSIPDEIADVSYTNHLLEHINPAPADPRLAGLVDLLLAKSLVTKKEIEASVGDYRFLGGFIRFMDEVWRITKPGGQFISGFPYAGSPGYWQDPGHINPINHVTMAYFDPMAKDESGNLYHIYTIYRPKPWKIIKCFYDQNGYIEVALEKRKIDRTYHVTSENGMAK